MSPEPDLSEPTPPLFEDPSRPAFGTPGSAEQGAEQGTDEAQGALDGRLALVTGATGLLGAAMAAELAARGAIVCLLARDLAALGDLVDDLGAQVRSVVLRADLAAAEEIVSAVEFLERLDRRIDVVVHAAGLQAGSRIVDGSVESLDEHYLLNVRGPYLLTQQLMPLLGDDARVVFFATEHQRGRAGDAHHGITAAAGRALAHELRTEAGGDGIRVLSVLATHGAEAVDLDGRHVDPARFADAVASSVVDAVVAAEVELTELRVRGVPHHPRSERR